MVVFKRRHGTISILILNRPLTLNEIGLSGIGIQGRILNLLLMPRWQTESPNLGHNGFDEHHSIRLMLFPSNTVASNGTSR